MEQKKEPFLFDFSELVLAIVRKWRVLVVNAVIALLIAFGYSFFIAKKQYVSTVTFLPPFEDKSLINLLPGIPFNSFSTSSDFMPQQIFTIFNSKSIKRRLVENFNLYAKYKLLNSPNKFELALKRLKKDLLISSEELGSFGMSKQVSFSIIYFHTSPDTAFEGVKFAFSLVDSMIREVGVDKGRRNRIFIENQLKMNQTILDTLNKQFEEFQKTNKIYNIPSQVQLSLNNYGRIRSKIIANELRIKSLKQDYTENHPSITVLKKENSVLESELSRIEAFSSPDILMGLEKSTELFPEYTTYLRNIEIQNKLILLLTQQLEEAKLREARDYSSLKIVDPPFVGEYKARPKRVLLLASIFIVYMTLLIIMFSAYHIYKIYITRTTLFNEILTVFRKHSIR